MKYTLLAGCLTDETQGPTTLKSTFILFYMKKEKNNKIMKIDFKTNATSKRDK